MGWNPPETNRQNHFAHKRWRVVTRPSTTPINRQAIGTRDHATKFMCEVISSVGFWWRLALSSVVWGRALLYIEDGISIMGVRCFFMKQFRHFCLNLESGIFCCFCETDSVGEGTCMYVLDGLLFESVYLLLFIYETIPSHLYRMGWNPPETNRQNHFAHKRWRVVTRPSTTPINRQAIGTRDHATKFMCEVISSVGFWWRLALSIVVWGRALLYIEDGISIMC